MLKSFFDKIENILSRLLKNDKMSDIVCVSALVVVVLIIFRNIFSGEPLQPGRDSYFLDFPFRFLAWQSVTTGNLPLWNPYNSGGINLMGQPFFFLLYPFYDLIYLFPKEKIFYILSIVQIFHIFLALLGMYFLLRKLIKNPLISFWGSILYGFSLPVFDAFIIGQLIVSYAYFPWLMLFIYTLNKRRLVVNIIGFSLLLFLTIAGGFLQWTFYVLAIVFLLMLFIYNPLKEKSRPKFFSVLRIFFLSLILVFLLGAIEFLPFIEQNINGARGNISFHNLHTQELNVVPWLLIFRLIAPHLFDLNLKNFIPTPGVFLADNFDSYFGIIAFILCISGLIILRKKWLCGWKITFIAIIILALNLPLFRMILSLIFMRADFVYTRIGNFLPCAGIVLACVMLRLSLAQNKYIKSIIKIFILAAFSLVIALFYFKIFGKATLGNDLNVDFIHGQIIGAIVITVSCLILFVLYKTKFLRKNTFILVLCFLSFFEVKYALHNQMNSHLVIRPSRDCFGMTQSEIKLSALLSKDKNDYRVHNTSVRFESLADQLGGAYMHYFPNANIFNGFYAANGYILNMQKDVGQLLTNTRGGYFIRMADLLTYNSLPNLLSIKYIVAPAKFDPYNVKPKSFALDRSRNIKVIEEFSDGPKDNRFALKIIELENIPPRFYFAKKIRAGLDRETIFDNIINAKFNPEELTYFEDAVKEETFETGKMEIVKIETPSSNEVILKIKTDRPAVLVANNFWHKWWKAKVNGIEQRIYRVNYNFQAINVPAGESTVYFYCNANSVTVGLFLSIIG
ncbi:MAG: hypothetical protein WC330_08340, partial [Candidatus Omnitrophota bacterium]